MKTQQEIEKLAEQWLAETPIKEWGGVENGYIKGYSQCQKDMYEFGKLVLDTFHSEGRTHSGKDRLARIKFDAWFKQLNKQD